MQDRYLPVARKKVVEVGKQTGRGNKKVQQNSAKPLETRRTIAKAADVSHDTVTRVEKIIAKAPTPVLEQLRKGEVSINEAYKHVRCLSAIERHPPASSTVRKRLPGSANAI